MKSSYVFEARFAIGEIVTIRKSGIRGVICEVDEVFKGSTKWFEEMGLGKALRQVPWYQIMIENGEEPIYVPESNLEKGKNKEPVSNVRLPLFFTGYENGRYKRLSH